MHEYTCTVPPSSHMISPSFLPLGISVQLKGQFAQYVDFISRSVGDAESNGERLRFMR